MLSTRMLLIDGLDRTRRNPSDDVEDPLLLRSICEEEPHTPGRPDSMVLCGMECNPELGLESGLTNASGGAMILVRLSLANSSSPSSVSKDRGWIPLFSVRSTSPDRASLECSKLSGGVGVPLLEGGGTRGSGGGASSQLSPSTAVELMASIDPEALILDPPTTIWGVGFSGSGVIRGVESAPMRASSVGLTVVSDVSYMRINKREHQPHPQRYSCTHTLTSSCGVEQLAPDNSGEEKSPPVSKDE